MDIIQEFQKDYESKYEINDKLVQEYQKARKEYMDVKNKYSNTLNKLNGQLYDLREKVQILTDEKVNFEKRLNFDAADKKQKDIEKIINDINKISERVKTVKDTLENNDGEIKEKASRLMEILSKLSIEVGKKYNDAFADFHGRREEYNRKIQDEIPKILSPLGEMIYECRSLNIEIKGY